MIRKLVSRNIFDVDNIRHRLNIPGRTLCDWADITVGWGPGSPDFDSRGLETSWFYNWWIKPDVKWREEKCSQGFHQLNPVWRRPEGGWPTPTGTNFNDGEPSEYWCDCCDAVFKKSYKSLKN